jgi:hypothetical protein
MPRIKEAVYCDLPAIDVELTVEHNGKDYVFAIGRWRLDGEVHCAGNGPIAVKSAAYEWIGWPLNTPPLRCKKSPCSDCDAYHSCRLQVGYP